MLFYFDHMMIRGGKYLWLNWLWSNPRLDQIKTAHTYLMPFKTLTLEFQTLPLELHPAPTTRNLPKFLFPDLKYYINVVYFFSLTFRTKTFHWCEEWAHALPTLKWVLFERQVRTISFLLRIVVLVVSSNSWRILLLYYTAYAHPVL